MSLPETAGATRPSLAQDWLQALRYWLRGRNGVIALIGLALVVGAALNWSWLVAAGVAPLLLTVLPCVVMCGLGLCRNRMMGSSCSTSSGTSDQSSTPMSDAVQRIAVSELGKRTSVSVTAKAGALPDLSSSGVVEPAPDEQARVLKERE
jgi:hypothetical protein